MEKNERREEMDIIRKKLLFTLIDLAREIGISYVVLLKYFKYDPSISYATLRKIRNFLEAHGK